MSSLRRMVVTTTVALLTLGAAHATKEGVDGYKGWRSADAVKERTAPVGKVYLEGDEIPNAAPAVASVSSGPRTGEQIYNTACMACHGTGAAGAPKLGDKAAWAPRIKQGPEVLWNHLLNGLNAMPAKGMCMDCSDDELKAVLAHMTDAAK